MGESWQKTRRSFVESQEHPLVDSWARSLLSSIDLVVAVKELCQRVGLFIVWYRRRGFMGQVLQAGVGQVARQVALEQACR